MFERGRKDGTESGSGFSGDMVPGASAERPAPRSTGNNEAAVIGRSIHIDGDLRGEEDLRIEGDVNGTIQLKGNSLTIGQEGRIHADIYAKSIIVDGLVEGDLYGAERVGIRKNAKVHGNITAPRVSLEEGAKFKGSIEMDTQAVEAALGTSQSASKPKPSSMSSAKPGAAKVEPTSASSKIEPASAANKMEPASAAKKESVG